MAVAAVAPRVQVKYKFEVLKTLVGQRFGYADPNQMPDEFPQPTLETLTASDGSLYEGWVVWVERVSASQARVRLGDNGSFATILVELKQ